ncbi:amidohydrolase family protein [Fuerstiella marisgermanici]|uniref:Putative metal-dependent hydrolase of the TIM-barrel fold protein n=1 Tax=Fuerstiella marisgermanici TaxID=1891926 RepID=A0A1P8WHU1_9PLAN|nr:amidohydrolase family protein [Fuerstiella marisgermanici]APZ93630.1 putative metal-dependent hydrolase of the TIM-barrel fold protein [Fuerstiella marisgermanici]
MPDKSQISRRDALAASVAVVGSTTLAARAAASAAVKAEWIDAHSHIWTSDTSVFKLQPGITVEDLAPKDFTAKDLMAVAAPQGVGRVVLIQHNVFHGADNSYLIDAWRQQPDRFRVVAIVDDLRSNAGKAMRQLFQQGVTGLRIRPRKGITDWLQTDGMINMWKTAAETRQSMCCLMNPEHIAEVDAACQRHPDTPVVIDHFARIGVDGTVREKDVSALSGLAKHKHVKVKISAYYALGKKRPPYHDLVPMIKRLFEAYGADRLMWASDCPYQLTGDNSYEASIALIRDHIDFVSDKERRKLLRTTAEQTFFYNQ